MTSRRTAAECLRAGLILMCAVSEASQLAASQDTPTKLSAKSAKPAKTPVYLDPTQLDLAHVLPPPPAQDSEAIKAELAELHRIEQGRTAAMKAAAEYDDLHEDMFLYASVLGPAFRSAGLPLTMALSAHLRNDVSVVNGPLKTYFHRPRPYNFDATLHPICETNLENSYPSGHALNGYVYALVLTQMVPEKSVPILQRADEYAHQRMVCEAHYASDLEASRRVAYALLGQFEANPRFRADLAAARAESRKALALPPLPSP